MSLGIYIQVPFCQTKCTYCNFHTGVVSASRYEPYAETVCGEIRRSRDLYSSAGIELPKEIATAAVDTVYIGGGTPSLLDPKHLGQMLEEIRRVYWCNFQEVTLEADPETIERENAKEWVAAGIDRISLGAQSFSDTELKAAGRIHRRDEIGSAVANLREVGIAEIGLDLIAGLPNQTRESWSASVEELLALAPEHISIYMLEVDEGSRLGREVLEGGSKYSARTLPPDDDVADFYELARDRFRGVGYHHYEISNWAKPGFESRHNLKYWRREPYLGFGAGAHSFSGKQRWANAHDAGAYVRMMGEGRLPVEQVETVTREKALEEELFLGLRQLDGIDVGRIEKEYGVSLMDRFAPLALTGLVEWQGSVVRLAPTRLSVSNEVFVELLR